MVKKTQCIQKRVQLRTCIATRIRYPKKELLRFVLDKESKTVRLDINGKARGRGASLFPSLVNFDMAVQSGAFNRAFKTRINKENIVLLRKELVNYLEILESQLRVKKVVRVNSGGLKL